MTKIKKEDSEYWVDKKEFYKAICDHRKEQEINPDSQIPTYIAQCIINIATGVMSRYNFNRYSYRQDMISDAIITIIKYYNTFDINQSNNPYGYFWLAAYRAGQRKVIVEKQQQAIKAKTVQSMVIDDDILSTKELTEFNNYMAEFSDFNLDEYELSISKKKKKRKNNLDMVTTKKQRDEANEKKRKENAKSQKANKDVDKTSNTGKDG